MEAGVLELICNVKLTLNKFEKVRAPLIVSTEELHSLSVWNLHLCVKWGKTQRISHILLHSFCFLVSCPWAFAAFFSPWKTSCEYFMSHILLKVGYLFSLCFLYFLSLFVNLCIILYITLIGEKKKKKKEEEEGRSTCMTLFDARNFFLKNQESIKFEEPWNISPRKSW